MNLTDLAFAGATSDNALVQGFAGPNSTIPVPSAIDQATADLNGTDVSHIQGSVIIILVGANDVFLNTNITAQETVTNVGTILDKLQDKGTNKFLLLSYPDMGSLPLNASITPEVTQILHEYSSAFQTEIAHLASLHHVAYAKVYELFQKIFENPGYFGFDPNVVGKSCLTGAITGDPGTICANPDDFLFWDDVHVTDKGQRLVAELALKALLEFYW